MSVCLYLSFVPNFETRMSQASIEVSYAIEPTGNSEWLRQGLRAKRGVLDQVLDNFSFHYASPLDFLLWCSLFSFLSRRIVFSGFSCRRIPRRAHTATSRRWQTSAHFSFPTLLPGAAQKTQVILGTMTRVRSYNNVTSLLSSTRVVLL